MKRERLPAHEQLARTLAGRVKRSGSVRFHMFLIVAASVAMATIVTAGMLAVGVDALWKRYLPALLVAYGTFFLGVWLWLHMTSVGAALGVESPGAKGKARKAKKDDGVNVLDGLDVADAAVDVAQNLPSLAGRAASSVVRGGGGTFDGGGASASFMDSVGDSVGESVGESVGDAVGSVFGDEGGLALVVAIALVALALALLFGAAGYVIYQAPAILSEVVFELLLAQPLTRGMGSLNTSHWFAALFRRTVVPFVLVATAMLVFAAFASYVAPEARTAGEVLRTLAHGQS